MRVPVPHFAHRPVAPVWRLPDEAERSDVEMSFVGGATVTGPDLEKRELEGPGALFYPKVQRDAPSFAGDIQVVELVWHRPGERERSETRVIEAAATLRGAPLQRSATNGHEAHA
jgi:hypothetical protein